AGGGGGRPGTGPARAEADAGRRRTLHLRPQPGGRGLPGGLHGLAGMKKQSLTPRRQEAKKTGKEERGRAGQYPVVVCGPTLPVLGWFSLRLCVRLFRVKVWPRWFKPFGWRCTTARRTSA